jgi:hypothetical protein
MELIDEATPSIRSKARLVLLCVGGPLGVWISFIGA